MIMDVVLVPVPTTVVLTTMSNPTLMTTVCAASLTTIAAMKTYDYFNKKHKID